MDTGRLIFIHLSTVMFSMAPYATDPAASEVFGVWDSAIHDLVSYRYLGCQSVVLDREHAVGRMRLRHDLRTSVGLLSAPLAIASLDAAGNNLDRYYHLALTHVEVDVFDSATDVDEVVIHNHVVREARSQLFTEARIEASGDPDRVLAYAIADWSVLAPTPPGFEYHNPGEGVADTPDLPPLWQVYRGHARRGGGFVIDRLSPAIGSEVLHHGPILVLSEAAALEAAATQVGSDRLVVEHAATRIVAGGRRGPFVVTAEVLPTRDLTVVRTELRDQGAADRLVAVALLRIGAV